MLLRFLIAAAFGVVGIAGLILPILPGWLFLLVGLLVLFPTSRMSSGMFDRLEKRMPRFGRVARRVIAGKRSGADTPRPSVK